MAQARRLGRLLVPNHLLETVREEQRSNDYGVGRIDQHALTFLPRAGNTIGTSEECGCTRGGIGKL